MAESGGLLNRYTDHICIGGSNPPPSATLRSSNYAKTSLDRSNFGRQARRALERGASSEALARRMTEHRIIHPVSETSKNHIHHKP